MPKPKSGNDPWKAVAVKLPPDLLEEVGRYADLYHTSVSALIREGLELRLHGQQSADHPSGMTVIPSATAALLPHLADTLSAVAAELRKACHLPSEGLVYNGHTDTTLAPEEPVADVHPRGNTVIPAVAGTLRVAETLAVEVDEEPDAGVSVPALTSDSPPSQPGIIPGHTVDDKDYDQTTHLLGKLCPRQHEYRGTGQSVLRISNRHCRVCDREKFHERKQAKRQAQGG